MRYTSLFLLCFVFTAACFDTDSETKKVELVDNTTKNDPTTGKQAVSDEDFAALQEKVKALEAELAALKTGKADAADVTALAGELAALKSTNNDLDAELAAVDAALNSQVSRINALYADPLKAPLYMYDGNKVRRHVVHAVVGDMVWVTLETGVRTAYPLNAATTATWAPGTQGTFYHATADCSDHPVLLRDEVPSPAGTTSLFFLSLYRNGTSFAAYVTPEATPVSVEVTHQSFLGTGCFALPQSETAVGYPVSITDLAELMYPNPITVGP